MIDLHGVIDDELDRLQWVDRSRVPAELTMPSRMAPRSTMSRNAGEILEQDPRGGEGDFLRLTAT